MALKYSKTRCFNIKIDKDFEKIQREKLGAKSIKYMGLYLSGAKNDRTTLCELQYYPKYRQLVVSGIRDDLASTKTKSADSILVEEFQGIKNLKALGVNVSTQTPPCLRCKLKCPGIEKCRVEEVVWLKDAYKKVSSKNKNAKMAMPYTDRPAEYFLNHFLEKHIEAQYSLSANAAPLTARMFFLQKHLKMKVFEVHPGLSVWRIGSYLKVQKSYLKHYKNSDDCEVIRLYFLDQLKEKLPIFLYNQDKQGLVSNPRAFDAFICSLSVFYSDQKLAEPKPKDFPKKAVWPCLPSKSLSGLFD